MVKSLTACLVTAVIMDMTTIKDSGWNRFKSLLEAYAVAGGQTTELISHLTYLSNEYECAHLDDKNWIGGYKWINVTVVVMFCFLGIILKMSVVLFDLNGFHSLWYPPTYPSISLKCNLKLRIIPLFMFLPHFTKKVVLVKKEINATS